MESPFKYSQSFRLNITLGLKTTKKIESLTEFNRELYLFLQLVKFSGEENSFKIYGIVQRYKLAEIYNFYRHFMIYLDMKRQEIFLMLKAVFISAKLNFEQF